MRIDVESWTPGPGKAAQCHTLESLGKPPWLVPPEKTIEKRGEIFPFGQVVAKDVTGTIWAYAAFNRIEWSGTPEEFPQYYEVLGEDFDFSHTYDPQGNTLVLVSLAMHPAFANELSFSRFMQTVSSHAPRLGCTYFVAAFLMPPEESKQTWLARHGGLSLETNMLSDLLAYENEQRKMGNEQEYWWSGMKSVLIHNSAHAVGVDLPSFEEFRQKYHHESWKQVSHEDAPGGFVWVCEGEDGFWTTDGDYALFRGSIAWGIWDFLKHPL